MNSPPPGDLASSAMILQTSKDTIPLDAFYALNWVFLFVCIICFVIRAYIRYISFHRLIVEDYLMLVALCLHTADAVLIQLYVRISYDQEAVGRGDYSKMGPHFFDNARKFFPAIGACINMTIVGVLLVKLSFLLFFRRLGASIHRFNIAWWAVTIFTVAAAIAQIGMQKFQCFFNDVSYIFGPNCTNKAAKDRILLDAVFSSAVDAISDFFIIGLPITILWKSGVERRKKFVLTLIFGLVFLTIAITIVRGSIFHNTYSGPTLKKDGQLQSPSFTWFWFYCEFSVAFVIACIVSFRSLFVQRRNESDRREEVNRRRDQIHRSALQRGLRAKARYFHESLLDTCRTLEGVSSDGSDLYPQRLPKVPAGTMTVDFEDENNWKGNLVSINTRSEKDCEEGDIRLQSPPASLQTGSFGRDTVH